MGSLRKVLFIHAAVWGLLGLVLALIPGWLVDRVSAFYFDFVGPVILAAPNTTFARIIGVQAIVIAMFMVLVAQKIEAVWWWSWGFVIGDLLVVLISVLHPLFGLLPGESVTGWWLIAGVSLVFAIALMWGLFKAQQDQPIIEA